jgi:pimeloyl-ACP methyl ester carboxylesterase
MDESALAAHYRLLSYHRAGFAGSDRIEGLISIAEHAAHCALLMRHLGIERAHVVGHSSSAVIALQLALDFPDAMHTLALMEPARPVPPTEEQAVFVRDFVAPAMQRYRAGDKAGAVDTFARGVFGSGYRGRLEQGLPGLFEQAIADADAFFAQELPALQQWSFTQEEASRRLPFPRQILEGGGLERRLSVRTCRHAQRHCERAGLRPARRPPPARGMQRTRKLHEFRVPGTPDPEVARRTRSWIG